MNQNVEHIYNDYCVALLTVAFNQDPKRSMPTLLGGKVSPENGKALAKKATKYRTKIGTQWGARSHCQCSNFQRN